MASVISYTKKMLVERIRRHMANGWPNTDFQPSVNEILLYIDAAIATTMVGQVYGNAKIEGNLVMPEAYLTTYELAALAQDSVSGYWYTTLPQPPVNLPLGYSINRVYFGLETDGQSREVLPIRAKRVGYRINMPMPTGARYWVEGSKIWLAQSNGGSLLDIPLYAQMAKTRTDDITETLAMPDDAIDMVFGSVIKQLMQRMGIPQDVIKDDLPAGAKTS